MLWLKIKKKGTKNILFTQNKLLLLIFDIIKIAYLNWVEICAINLVSCNCVFTRYFLFFQIQKSVAGSQQCAPLAPAPTPFSGASPLSASSQFSGKPTSWIWTQFSRSQTQWIRTQFSGKPTQWKRTGSYFGNHQGSDFVFYIFSQSSHIFSYEKNWHKNNYIETKAKQL